MSGPRKIAKTKNTETVKSEDDPVYMASQEYARLALAQREAYLQEARLNNGEALDGAVGSARALIEQRMEHLIDSMLLQRATSDYGAFAQLVLLSNTIDDQRKYLKQTPAETLQRERRAYTGLCSLAAYFEKSTGLDRNTILGDGETGFWHNPDTVVAEVMAKSAKRQQDDAA